MVEHIAYDIVELEAQYTTLRRGESRSSAKNAAVLAFLVHARNLFGFYWPPPPALQHDGDVFAFDFVRDLVIEAPSTTETVPELKKAISTRVAHICLLRIEKLQWTANVINSALLEACEVFLANLREPFRSEFVKHQVIHESW